MKNKNIQIEFPAVGQTYAYNEYAAYEYRGARRIFLGCWKTLEEARSEYPNAAESINPPIPDWAETY